MPIESIELTGSAVTGIGPANAFSAVNGLPTRVCLGRIKPKAMPAALNLSAYVDSASMGPLPASTNWREKAAASIARMYKNNQLGCCVISGKAHNLGVWSANDSDSGGIVLATDDEIVNQYHAICGPGDNGCMINDVLDVMRSKGFVAGGKTYKIDGYLTVDNTKQDLVKVTQLIFGASTIGFDLPDSWTNSNIWDVTNSRIVGGHDVSPIDFDEQGVYVSSWGRIYLMTWAAFTSKRWISEYYAMLAPLWYNSDMVSPSGLKVDELKVDLEKIGKGIIPDIGPPVPIGPPVAANNIRLTMPLGMGSYEDGKIVLGSNMQAGEYQMILQGEGPPPNVP